MEFESSGWKEESWWGGRNWKESKEEKKKGMIK